MKQEKLLGFYDYTVVLTYAGMLFAFFGIMMSINARFFEALICLMGSGLCDMFDGAVASTKLRTPEEKRFGIQIDSLSDLISFGVMPAVFVYMISECNPKVGFFSAFYTLAALIRLSYFNVMEEIRQQETDERREYFTGLPVTSIALFLPLLYVFETKLSLHNGAPYMVLLMICGVGFISSFEVKKPHGIFKVILMFVGILEVLGLVIVARGAM